MSDRRSAFPMPTRPLRAPAILVALAFLVTIGPSSMAPPLFAPAVSAAARPHAPAQACGAVATRTYSGGGLGGPQWGDEVTVGVEVRLDCPAGQVARLAVVETLPPEIRRVGGIGRPPDAVAGQALTWHFDRPAVAPDVLRFSYRIYATPDWGGFDSEGRQAVAWPMLVEITEGGAPRRLPPPDLLPLVVRERQGGLGCGLARVRAFAPDRVMAGQPFEVRLGLTVNLCSAHRWRTRGVIALQPAGDDAAALQLAQVNTALLDPGRVAPDNAMFGMVVNLQGGPKVQAPTTEFVYLEDLARGQGPVADGGADAAAALSGALDLLADDWPFHHEVVYYITHGRAPRADPAVIRDLLAAAAGRGVEVVAICVGGGCDPALAYAHEPADLRILRRDVLQGLLETHRGPPVVVEAIEVGEKLLKFIQVEAGSASPAGGTQAGDVLRWRVPPAAVGTTLDVTYRARIDIYGRLPIGIGSFARLIYAGGGQTTFGLPRSMITVDPDPNAVPKPCRAAVAKTAAPPRVPLGDPVTVQLDFGAECPSETSLVDVVLVLDVSGSMGGQKIEDAREAARTFVDIVQPGPATVGLVTFNHAVVAREPLTADFDRIRLAIGQMAAEGGTNIAEGIRAATDALSLRRRGSMPVIIVMTDGFNNDGPAPMLDAALAARASGILVASVCFGGQCEPALPDVATAPEYYFMASDADGLQPLFAHLALMLREMRLATARVVDVLPPHMRYVPGSAVPPPSAVEPATADRGQTLVWEIDDPPLGTTRLRYQAEPLILGPQPTNAEATVAFVDDRGRPGSAVFPIPVVETYIPDPKGPCVPALGKTADRLEVEIGDPVAVDLTIRLDCPKRAAPMDIVLVVDHSASMGSLDRLVNAKRAAGAFIEAVDASTTRIGLVSFAEDVTGRTELTADFGVVRRAVDALRPEGRTAISQALNAARDLLAARRPEALGAVVLLTDGANTAGVETMLAAADRLKNSGAALVTVCAGECDAALPRAASKAAFAFNVQDSAALVALFRDLASTLTRDRVTNLVVTDSFPTAIEVDPASFNPAPATHVGDTAVWRFAALPDAGLALGYTVRPLVAGRVPANRFARLDYVFGLGQTGSAFFPVPVLQVGRATATPTASATGVATATGTATAGSATATAGSATATPSATAGVGRWRAWLPYGGRE